MFGHLFSISPGAGSSRRGGLQRLWLGLLAAVLLLALFLAPMQAAAAPAVDTAASTSAATCAYYHTVRVGETLGQIGQAYGVSWTTLAAVNNLSNPNRIYAGQVLCIPAAGSPPPPPPPSCQVWHTVRAGETLASIGRTYGVAWTTIATANNLGNANRIYAGQQLCIPAGGTVPPPAGASGTVNAYYLNVRSGPGVGYGVIAWLVRNQTVPVTHRNASATWVRVQLPNGTYGWVNASWLALNTPVGNLPVGG